MQVNKQKGYVKKQLNNLVRVLDYMEIYEIYGMQ